MQGLGLRWSTSAFGTEACRSHCNNAARHTSPSQWVIAFPFDAGLPTPAEVTSCPQSRYTSSMPRSTPKRAIFAGRACYATAGHHEVAKRRQQATTLRCTYFASSHLRAKPGSDPPTKPLSSLPRWKTWAALSCHPLDLYLHPASDLC